MKSRIHYKQNFVNTIMLTLLNVIEINQDTISTIIDNIEKNSVLIRFTEKKYNALFGMMSADKKDEVFYSLPDNARRIIAFTDKQSISISPESVSMNA